jgi:hypothetical protein
MSPTLPPVQPSKWDALFKEIITAGWAVKSDGHVESPQGYFAVVEIPDHQGELDEMKDALDLLPGEEMPPSGWYFTIENNQGLIFVYRTIDRNAAFFFKERMEEFAKWDVE